MKLISSDIPFFIFTLGCTFALGVSFASEKKEEEKPCPLECVAWVECLPCVMVKDTDGTPKGHGGWCYVNKSSKQSKEIF